MLFGITFQDVTKPATRITAAWLNTIAAMIESVVGIAGFSIYATPDQATADNNLIVVRALKSLIPYQMVRQQNIGVNGIATNDGSTTGFGTVLWNYTLNPSDYGYMASQSEGLKFKFFGRVQTISGTAQITFCGNTFDIGGGPTQHALAQVVAAEFANWGLEIEIIRFRPPSPDVIFPVGNYSTFTLKSTAWDNSGATTKKDFSIFVQNNVDISETLANNFLLYAKNAAANQIDLLSVEVWRIPGTWAGDI